MNEKNFFICFCLALTTWDSGYTLAAPISNIPHSATMAENVDSGDSSIERLIPIKLPPAPPDLPNPTDKTGSEIKVSPSPPSTLLQLRVNSSNLSNANLASDDADGSIVFVNSADLLLTPLKGEKTELQARVGGSLLRYAEGGSGYNSFNLGLSVKQYLGRKTYTEASWLRQNVEGLGDFDDEVINTVGLAFNRQEPITNRLRLQAIYQLQGYFTDSQDSDRVSNRLGLGFTYHLTSGFQANLNYRLTLSEFTRRNDSSTRQQISTSLIYKPSKETFVGASISYLFGEGFNSLGTDTRDLDNVSLGIHFGLNFPLLQH